MFVVQEKGKILSCDPAYVGRMRISVNYDLCILELKQLAFFLKIKPKEIEM